MRESISNAPNPEKELPKLIPEYRLRMKKAVDDGDVDALVNLVVDVNENVLTLAGFPQLSKLEGASLKEAQSSLAKFVDDAKKGIATAKIDMSDGAWTRMILRYNRYDAEVFSIFLNQNNARAKVFETWKKMGGET